LKIVIFTVQYSAAHISSFGGISFFQKYGFPLGGDVEQGGWGTSYFPALYVSISKRVPHTTK